MEHFNPGLQKLVALGNAYVKAFQGERARLVRWIKFREYMKLENFTLIYVYKCLIYVSCICMRRKSNTTLLL